MKNSTCSLMAALVVVSFGFCIAQVAEGDELVPVGLKKQLLVDDYVIAEKIDLRRVLGKVTKANGGEPVMVADKPWEDDGFGFYGTVLHDGDKFRMWYNPFRFAVAYAESDDGLHWRKPELGLYHFSIEQVKKESSVDGTFRPREGAQLDWQGKQNNILGFFGDGFTCILDSHETDPAHRYKASYGHPNKICACIAHSADGIHWTPYNEGEPVTGRASDTYNQVVWDEAAHTYRLLTRAEFDRDGREVRGNRVMTNPDIKANPTAWETVKRWQFDREGPKEYQRRQLYAMNDWIYEGIHFGLIWVYEWPHESRNQVGLKTEGTDHYKRHDRDVMEFYIAPSRNGTDWDLDWVYAGKQLIPRGPDGSFDKDMVKTASNIVTWQDKHWIYYAGSRERHWQIPRKPEIGLATLPLDRFVGLEAKQKIGTATTHPFKLNGGQLKLNVDAREGNVCVEVLNQAGQPLERFSAQDCSALNNVDGLRESVQWKGGRVLADLKGKIVRLRFTLHNATLYAFQVQP